MDGHYTTSYGDQKVCRASKDNSQKKAKVSKQVRNLAYISAEITNSKGELCNEGEAIYFLMNEEKAKEMGFLHCEVKTMVSSNRLNRKKDPMGRAIADYWKTKTADRLKVFSPMFEEDEIPLTTLFRSYKSMHPK